MVLAMPVMVVGCEPELWDRSFGILVARKDWG